MRDEPEGESARGARRRFKRRSEGLAASRRSSRGHGPRRAARRRAGARLGMGQQRGRRVAGCDGLRMEQAPRAGVRLHAGLAAGIGGIGGIASRICGIARQSGGVTGRLVDVDRPVHRGGHRHDAGRRADRLRQVPGLMQRTAQQAACQHEQQQPGGTEAASRGHREQNSGAGKGRSSGPGILHELPPVAFVAPRVLSPGTATPGTGPPAPRDQRVSTRLVRHMHIDARCPLVCACL